LNNIVDKSLDLVAISESVKSGEYQKFFKAMLKKYGVKSPSELKGEKRKKFFNDVKINWAKQKKK
jgi:hypothetical protein